MYKAWDFKEVIIWLCAFPMPSFRIEGSLIWVYQWRFHYLKKTIGCYWTSTRRFQTNLLISWVLIWITAEWLMRRMWDSEEKMILATYICPEARRDKHVFSESGIYYSPAVGKQDDYLKYISDLPLNLSPEGFGLHENADITNAQNETRYLLEAILLVQPRSSFRGFGNYGRIPDLCEKNPQRRDCEEWRIRTIDEKSLLYVVPKYERIGGFSPWSLCILGGGLE